ncbi:DUF418 domain-containing protein [Novosphingobium sp.]|uniref:DUF418 domain-containing protein n=1 Tax=Novosphingobium sp. TaxID=1874826 RepID=UPI0026005943|nr:DUF418 domain-containing protein [Novosphingobium sp.]MCC6926432.1 DUF418 domain-containing protein [Novosphingobium sp.]
MLGILVVNMPGFAGTEVSPLTPHLPVAGSLADERAFAASLVLFEGKMRALFTLLFGASMLLFIERAEAQGRDGQALQIRRLGLLALFGYLHYALLWWGDILLIYALLGLLALALREMENTRLAVAAVAFFVLWHLVGMATTWPDIALDAAVRDGTASAKQLTAHHDSLAQYARNAATDLGNYRMGWPDQVIEKLTGAPFSPFEIALNSLGETVPLMLIGMVLYRTGFFAGAWPKRRLIQLAGWGIGLGTLITVLMVWYVWQLGFPAPSMFAFVVYWSAIPHLLVAMGYLAALVLIAPRLLDSWLGNRLEAAGRMAFSNYILSSLIMCAIFYGWGLGLVGTVGHAGQIPFVLLGWTVMLAWSQPWLARFHQGPLEWLWRSLTEQRVLVFRRG